MLLLFSVILIVVDYQTSALGKIRTFVSIAITPIQWMVDLPQRSWAYGREFIFDRQQMVDDNKHLRQQLMLVERKAQKLAFLTAENVRLRELLNAASKLDEEVFLTDLIGVNPDPFVHQIIVDSGSQKDAFISQPVLDQSGIMGQVVEVNPFVSRVLLITDANHAIPVRVNRTGLRSVAYGTGQYDQLELVNIVQTDDIKVGDLLVSSGLGMVFPEGYPVAKITRVERQPGAEFAKVIAKPTARLNQSRQLLLVKTRYQQRKQQMKMN